MLYRLRQLHNQFSELILTRHQFKQTLQKLNPPWSAHGRHSEFKLTVGITRKTSGGTSPFRLKTMTNLSLTSSRKSFVVAWQKSWRRSPRFCPIAFQ